MVSYQRHYAPQVASCRLKTFAFRLNFILLVWSIPDWQHLLDLQKARVFDAVCSCQFLYTWLSLRLYGLLFCGSVCKMRDVEAFLNWLDSWLHPLLFIALLKLILNLMTLVTALRRFTMRLGYLKSSCLSWRFKEKLLVVIKVGGLGSFIRFNCLFSFR